MLQPWLVSISDCAMSFLRNPVSKGSHSVTGLRNGEQVVT
jgi:hypothetical protein